MAADFHHALKFKHDLCIGCSHCMSICPTGAIHVENGIPILNVNRCVDCGRCYQACPTNAIYIEQDDFQTVYDYKYPVLLLPSIFISQFEDKIKEKTILSALYHLGSWGEASYSTSTAVRIDAEVGFSTTGYVFRSETPLSGSVEGAFYCPAGDGSNVQKGASIGGIYPGKDTLTEELRALDQTIALLTEGAEKKDLASATARLKSLTASLNFCARKYVTPRLK